MEGGCFFIYNTEIWIVLVTIQYIWYNVQNEKM